MSNKMNPANVGKVIMIGVTGGTGHQAVRGLIAQGYNDLYAMTRDLNKPSSSALEKLGVTLLTGDLDDPASLEKALTGMDVMYLHGTTADIIETDSREVPRAKDLIAAAEKNNIKHIVYNSVDGGERNSGVIGMEYKFQVEELLRASSIPATMLRATLFMEEWWKHHNRPAILQGSYNVVHTSDYVQQLISVRDMGWTAGIVFRDTEKYAGKNFAMASDALSIKATAEAFSAAQDTVVTHNPLPIEMFQAPELKQMADLINWYNNHGHQADVAAIHQEFPGIWSFSDFLKETQWGDEARSYASFSDGSYDC